MNEQVTQLLSAGRTILAAKKAEQERSIAETREKNRAIFADARAQALELLAPLGSVFEVTPTEANFEEYGCWDAFARKNSQWFSVRPFDAGCISVRLQGMQLDGVVTWKLEDSRYRYHVDLVFHVGEGGNDESCVSVTIFESTNSLAEALALFESATEAYRTCAAQVKERNAQQQCNFERSRKPTSRGERLLSALEDWVGSVLPSE